LNVFSTGMVVLVSTTTDQDTVASSECRHVVFVLHMLLSTLWHERKDTDRFLNIIAVRTLLSETNEISQETTEKQTETSNEDDLHCPCQEIQWMI
jgi:hypothetical protein